MMIAVVALIVLGPDRMPEAARTIGKGIRDFRRAIEPARSAWTDLTGEITNVTGSVTGSMTGLTNSLNTSTSTLFKPAHRGEMTTAITTDNPWTVHPIMANMTEEERAEFMRGGQMPPKILEEMARNDALHTGSNDNNGDGSRRASGAFPEITDLDYPMPHSELFYQPAPPFNKPAEQINYPSPGATPQEETKTHEQDS